MSRPPHLDTRTGQRQRYSFETPLEMHAPSQFPDSASQLAIPTTTGTTIQPCPDQQPHEQHQHQQPPSFHYTSQEQPTRGATNEKERHLQREGFIPTYSKYPPLEQHPALHPSLADVPQPQIAQLHQAPYHSSPPPGSPGPLPVKTNQEAPIRDDAISITPDANPLQSPTSPYFPPPTITKSQTPQISDWDPYHQPGQIMHPNQEVKGGTWSYGLCECSNIGTCCLGLLCPCILYGKTQHRLSMKSKKEDPTNMLGYGMCNASCTAMAVLCGGQCKLLSTGELQENIRIDLR